MDVNLNTNAVRTGVQSVIKQVVDSPSMYLDPSIEGKFPEDIQMDSAMKAIMTGIHIGYEDASNLLLHEITRRVMGYQEVRYHYAETFASLLRTYTTDLLDMSRRCARKDEYAAFISRMSAAVDTVLQNYRTELAEVDKR